MTDVSKWVKDRSEEDRRLYEHYGKPLEEDHTGEYIAIGPDGRTILGTCDVKVVETAIQTFGSGNFTLARVGHRTFGRWLAIQVR